MKHNLYIQPRRSGKTTTIVNMYRENTGCIITSDTENKKTLVRDYDINPLHIHTPSINLLDFINNYNILYIEEYFSLPLVCRRTLFNSLIMDNLVCNVKAFGTPTKQYNEQDAILVSQWWNLFKNKAAIVKILKTEEQMCERFGADLLYNMLVCPTVNVHQWKTNEKSFLSKEQYEMEFLGEIFK